MYRALFVWFSDLEPAYVCKGLAKAAREDVVIPTARDPLFGLLGVWGPFVRFSNLEPAYVCEGLAKASLAALWLGLVLELGWGSCLSV